MYCLTVRNEMAVQQTSLKISCRRHYVEGLSYVCDCISYSHMTNDFFSWGGGIPSFLTPYLSRCGLIKISHRQNTFCEIIVKYN